MTKNMHNREPSYLEYKGTYKGLFAWIFSTDHKRIGLLYLYSIMTFFIVGALLGLSSSLTLFVQPGMGKSLNKIHGVE